METIKDERKRELERVYYNALANVDKKNGTKEEKDLFQILANGSINNAECELIAKEEADYYGQLESDHDYDYDFTKEVHELMGYNEETGDWEDDPLSVEYYTKNGEYWGAKILLSGGGPSEWIDTTDSSYHYSNGFCHGKAELPRDFIIAIDDFCEQMAEQFIVS